jgi:hypothetical protein
MKLITKYLMSIPCALIGFCSTTGNCYSQSTDGKLPKVSHAEPLFLDLVRDLGARKGEKEINIGANFANVKNYRENILLAEFEFAPINRLGLEAEVDLSFTKRTSSQHVEIPKNKLECLRLSAQYSFFVSEKLKTTLAVGYTQIIELTEFKNYGKRNLLTGTAYNPFFIAAKRWGKNFHSFIYAGPLFVQNFDTKATEVEWQINTSIHFTIPQSRHFIGIEFNKEFKNGEFEMTIRPQAKIKLNKNLALGLVVGFPINKKEEGFSSFMRIIYEL